MITYNLTYHYDNNANLHDYRLYVFVPAPLLYISLPCSCPMYFLYQLLILFFSSTNKGGIILFLGLSVPEEVPWCSACLTLETRNLEFVRYIHNTKHLKFHKEVPFDRDSNWNNILLLLSLIKLTKTS